MHSDDDFLRRLLTDPADNAARLVYADWLEEQGSPTADAKAEFLRLSVQLGSTGRKKQQQKLRRQLQQLAAGLDTAWLAVVSRLVVENCQGKATAAATQMHLNLSFDYLCDRQWQDLRSTEDRTVRFCDACQHNVHYCDTITEAREHAWEGHCIAVDLGVIRRDRDLRVMRMGRMSPEAAERERELQKPDAVSAERERRKQDRAGQGG